jgi:GNAT superfamily N-acetyltransferase
MNVRLAQIGEAAAVIDIYRGYDRPPDREMDPHEIESRFAEINRSGFVAVAVIDTVIVGSYSMYFCANLARAGRPFAVVENVIVVPSIRRRGIGRALMAHAQYSAREKGCYKVMLATGASRPENIRFYEACGFVGNKVGFQVRYDT